MCIYIYMYMVVAHDTYRRKMKECELSCIGIVCFLSLCNAFANDCVCAVKVYACNLDLSPSESLYKLF